MSRALVKICGQTRPDTARLCAELGADMLGFIFHPKSPRCTAPALPASLLLPGVLKVGVFVDQSVNETAALMRTGRLDVAQLHGGQDRAFCRALADVIGPERIMKVVWPEKAAHLEALQDELDRFAPLCGRFLADAGKDGGGHGRGIADAAADLLLQARFPRPWLLAGGLGPQTVGPAFAHFRHGASAPAGLDLNSGVESAPGVKDETLLRAAFAAINAMNAA
ncbi:MAG: phosphoribosylanthranilate isomerase [Desulfovibrio sp.]